MIISQRPSGLWWVFFETHLFGPFETRRDALKHMVLETLDAGYDDDAKRLYELLYPSPDGWGGE